MKRLYIACILSAFATHGFASNTIVDDELQNILEPSKKSIHFFKTQVSNNRSVSDALRALLTRYPDKTKEFVSIALAAYPEDYQEIITASVSTNPTFVDEIIMLANEHAVAKPTTIVEIAVNAEPSYAGVATNAACNYSPEYFNEIVKTAVLAQPDSADQIAQKLVNAFPNKTMEILVTTIKEVPFVGKYVLDALLATVEGDDAQSEEMIIISVEQLAQYPDAIDRLVQLARERNIDSDLLRESAVRGGLEEQDVLALIQKHYSQ
jgi:hypothetical protein